MLLNIIFELSYVHPVNYYTIHSNLMYKTKQTGMFIYTNFIGTRNMSL
jgi:hypothetical protein